MTHNNYPSAAATEQIPLPQYPDVRISPNGAEFDVGNIRYSYLGPTDKGKLFNSVGPDGIERPIMVYESLSQGSERVSQGYEAFQRKDGSTGQRLLKGRELSPDAQYTQDTQLHPEFEAAVARVGESRALRGLPLQAPRHFDEKGAEWLMRDFEAQTTLYPLGSSEVNQALTELKAGHLSKQDMTALTGLDPDTQPADVNYVFGQKIAALNGLLERSGIMPDFTEEPSSTQIVEYPRIGSVVKDTYIKTVDGVRYEWQMAHVHNSSTAWIERIRFADAEPSVYGTDKQLVNSGILTSKPLDYSDQCDGLSSFMKKDLGNGYSDITPFLATLAPIANYASTYQNREQFYHFAPKAA
jgi:hypothetical protein